MLHALCTKGMSRLAACVQVLEARTRVLKAMQAWSFDDDLPDFEALAEFGASSKMEAILKKGGSKGKVTRVRALPGQRGPKPKGKNDAAIRGAQTNPYGGYERFESDERRDRARSGEELWAEELLKIFRREAGGPKAELDLPLISPMYQCVTTLSPSSLMTDIDVIHWVAPKLSFICC